MPKEKYIQKIQLYTKEECETIYGKLYSLKRLPLQSNFTGDSLTDILNGHCLLKVSEKEKIKRYRNDSDDSDSSSDEEIDDFEEQLLELQILCTKSQLIKWEGFLLTCKNVINSLVNAYTRGEVVLGATLTFELEISVMLTSEAFATFESPNDEHFATHSSASKMVKTLKPVIQFFYKLQDDRVKNKTRASRKEISELYTYVKGKHAASKREKSYNHSSLLPKLRGYQEDAVGWMMKKEMCDSFLPGNASTKHPVWEKLVCDDGTEFFFNTYSGGLTRQSFERELLPKGGILADEMGLGKTVEVLACILNNPSAMRFKLSLAKPLEKLPPLRQIADHPPPLKPIDKKRKFEHIEVSMPEGELVECDGILRPLCDITNITPQTLLLTEHGSKKQKIDDIVENVSDDEVWHPKYNPKNTKPKVLTTMDDLRDAVTVLKEDHGYCQEDPSSKSLFLECCVICGDADKRDKIKVKVKCCCCENIMHQMCAGYLGLDVHKYFCPTCAIKQEMIDSHCTLIICPDTLLSQWVQEIEKHLKTDSLKYMVYEGVRVHKFLQPGLLAEFDIIVTAFSTLRADLNYVIAEKSNNSKLMDMCQRIHAQYVWCITGTPMEKGVEDIYVLLYFLGVHPYAKKLWWRRALEERYHCGDHLPLFDAIASVMWRTRKVDVTAQIGIPPQYEHLTWLPFTPVEQHNYHRELEKNKEHMREAMLSVAHVDKSLEISSLFKGTVNRILAPLLVLRKACCHPAMRVQGNDMLTMDQLVDKLIAATKLEAEEPLRQLVAAINGQAGVEILADNVDGAIAMYEKAIATWKEYETHDMSTDSLQKLHTLTNLLDIATKYEHRSAMEQEIAKIRTKYLAVVNADVKGKEGVWKEITDEMKNITATLDEKNPWWHKILDYATNCGIEENLMKRIKSVVVDGERHFNSIVGLQWNLFRKLDLIENSLADLNEELKLISKEPDTNTIKAVAECCLYDVLSIGHCKFCQFQRKLDVFEVKVNDDETVVGGENNTDRMLRNLLSWARSAGIDKNIVEEGQEGLKFYEDQKKQFRAIKASFVAHYGRIQSLDELAMCTMRMQLREEGDYSNLDKHYIILPSQIEEKRESLDSDRTVATSELSKKQSQLLYLKNLSTVENGEDGYNFDICPICCDKLGVQWSVFKCGHCVCCGCLAQLQKQAMIFNRTSKEKIKCPICRATTPNNDISLVVTKQKQPGGFDAHIKFKGYYSTKIEAVLRRILWIHEKDLSSKILVFSSWPDVLWLLSKALETNQVLYLSGSNPKTLQRNLDEFKVNTRTNVLLLPLTSGSRGLNITEATHVVLSEPSLNPGDELQAVGRVHRIGQHKETYVHRFYIRSTVEERMFEMLKDKQKSTDVNERLTLDDIISLFS